MHNDKFIKEKNLDSNNVNLLSNKRNSFNVNTPLEFVSSKSLNKENLLSSGISKERRLQLAELESLIDLASKAGTETDKINILEKLNRKNRKLEIDNEKLISENKEIKLLLTSTINNFQKEISKYNEELLWLQNELNKEKLMKKNKPEKSLQTENKLFKISSNIDFNLIPNIKINSIVTNKIVENKYINKKNSKLEIYKNKLIIRPNILLPSKVMCNLCRTDFLSKF